MLIGNTLIRDRILLPRRGPLEHEFKTDPDDLFPDTTTVTIYFYTKDWETELAFWPLDVVPGKAVMSIEEADHLTLPNHCLFRVLVTDPSDSLPRPWYGGAALREQ